MKRGQSMETQLNGTPNINNTKNTMVKSAVLLIILTVISKVFGFGREMTQANYFGANVYTDAYLMAMTIPTVLFFAVSTAINNVFIPVYDRFKSQGRDKALVWRVSQVCLALVIVLFFIPVMINPYFAVRLFAPDFSPYAIELAAGMLRILIFIVFFRLFSSISTAVLHVNRNFLVPGAIGIPYSLSIMGFSIFFSGTMGINALVWGTFLGVAIQFLMQVPWLAKVKMGGSITGKVNDGLKEIAFLLPPILMGSLAGQAKTITDRIFASRLAEGSISYLNYAIRIKELPLGLLVTSVVTVLYPIIVSQANKKEWRNYRLTLANSVNMLTFMMLPMMAGMAILALPITQLIYQRGEFTYEAAVATAYALRYLSPLLIGKMLSLMMIKAHYAVRDTRTPLLATLISVPANIILDAILIRFMDHGGLALATSISTTAGAVFMYWRLTKFTGSLLDKRILTDMGKSVVATLAMAAVCFVSYRILLPHIPVAFIGKMLYTLAIIGLSAGVYFALAWVMRISAMGEVKNLYEQIINKFKNKSA